MKQLKIIIGLFAVLTSAAFSGIAQEFTLVTTQANITSSRASVDMPGLTGNPLAIIVATPLGDTEMLNPNPIGAWYYSGKWNIFNTNQAVMPAGAKFKVQFFLKPGANQFLHLVTQQNLGSEGSYIDNPALNNQPNVQVTILQNHAPEARTPYNVNGFAAKAAYSSAAQKWYIANPDGKPLGRGSAYNVVVGSGGIIGINPTGGNPSDPAPTSLPPSGNAGGDLGGTYPNPTVQKLVGRPLSNVAPAVGQILRWNGTAWEPASETVGGNTGSTTYNAGTGLSLNGATFSARNTTAMWNANQLAGKDVASTAPTTGQILKWNGSAWMPAEDNVGIGTSGQNGEVLTSNGAGNPPSWKQPKSGEIQTYFQRNFVSDSPILSGTNSYVMAGITQNIVLAKKSRLVVSARINLRGGNCVLCQYPAGNFEILVNGASKSGYDLTIDIPPDANTPFTVSNYMFDLNPGNYKIEFKAVHFAASAGFVVNEKYSSIMVIGLE